MRKRTRNIALLVAIVAAVAVVGAGVLFFSGSQAGVTVVTLGVPVAVVVVVVLYVKGVVNRESTAAGEFVRDRARSAATELRGELTTHTRLREQYPNWETRQLDTELEQLADDFGAAGVDVELKNEMFTVRDPESPRAFDKLESSVSEFADQRDQAFVEFVRSEVESTEDALNRLSPDVLESSEIDAVSPTEVPSTADAERAESVLNRSRERGRETIGRACESVRDTISEYDGNPSVIREHLDEAVTRAEESAFTEAVDLIRQGTEAAEQEVESEFTSEREAIENLIETVESSVVSQFVDGDHLDTVEAVSDDLTGVGSAMDSAALDDAESQLRTACREMIRELESDLAYHIETIQAADIPVGFYTVPPAAGTDYLDKLDGTTTDEFRLTWLDAVGELTDAVEEAQQRAAVADSYEMVAEQIDDALRTDGTITGEELPVTEPTQFMELYADSNSEIEYEPGVPRLRAPGGGETYTLEVTAQLTEHGGDEREFDIELSGDSYQETATEREYIAAGTTFRDVPYGSYELTVSVDDEAFLDETQSIRITADQTVTVELGRQSIVERMCGADRSAVESELTTVSPQLESLFDDERYLTPEMDIAVTDEYVPCLLALWADSAGYDARVEDGQILVYDHEDLVENVRWQVEDQVVSAGEPISFDDIRERYLRVPATDEMLREVLRATDLDVTIDDTEVRPE